MHRPKLILLNGPPRSGKDTAAKFLENHINSVSTALTSHEKLSAPLKEIFAAVLELEIGPDFVVPYYEKRKEDLVETFGVSFRQFQIDCSEKFMKPLYGQDIFSRILLHRIHDFDGICLVSDCGFQHEFDYLSSKADVALIRLFRKNCDFANDSRQYVRGGITDFDVFNSSDDLGPLHASLAEVAQIILNRWGIRRA